MNATPASGSAAPSLPAGLLGVVSPEAAALHEQARALLASERLAIGSEAAERYELECQATRLDAYARIRHLPFPGGRMLRTPILVATMAAFKLRDAMW